MFSWAQIFLLAIQILIAFLVGYLVLLTLAAWRAPKQTDPLPAERISKFLILVPAHNEERLLPGLLDSMSHVDYPSSRYTIYVVADNCSDQTAEVAQQAGVQVYTRTNRSQLGKGYALNWLLKRLKQAGETADADAYIFFDADSLVSANFLQVMDARLRRGERAIQAYYAVRDPDRSWANSLRFAALAVLHYLRPQGRMAFGGSAGLKGNGMVFAASLMHQHTWSPSLTEDIELHMALLLSGERVTFAPDALVWGEMPDTLANTKSQHNRWEKGRLQMAQLYIPRLMRSAWVELMAGGLHRSFVLLDAVMEHIIPPFSIMAGATGLCLGLDFLFFGISKITWPAIFVGRINSGLANGNLLIGLGLIVGQVFYLLAGLFFVRAPKYVYQALLQAPRLIVWKIWQVLSVLVRQGQNQWIRTERNEG